MAPETGVASRSARVAQPGSAGAERGSGAEPRPAASRAAGSATGSRASGTAAGSRADSRVEYVSHLPGGIAVVSGWYRSHLARPRRSTPEPVRAEAITFPRPEADGIPTPDSTTVGFLAVLEHDTGLGRFALEMSGASLWVDLDEAEVVDLQTLAWLGLAGVDGVTRVSAMALLASAQPTGAGRSVTREFATRLLAFRDAVRERLPECEIDPDRPLGLSVELLHRVDARSFYVRGWMRDAAGEIAQLTAISPEGATIDLTGTLITVGRPDVEQFYGAGPEQQSVARSGFLAYFELAAPSHLDRGWLFQLRNRAGYAVEAHGPAVVDSPATVRSTMLNDLVHDRAGSDAVLRDHAFPLLSKLQGQRVAEAAIDSVVQYGAPPENPDVTIIVPLYQRIDFLEHQLAHFVDDPDISGADLIYVLDSPELATALNDVAAPLHRLYGVPFRTAIMRSNSGYALANNAGATLARGRRLLLLNSDVIPEKPGWVRRMVTFYDKTPNIGALGPKLIYEDQSIQHAGMYFVRPAGSSWWENAHFFKGLHRSFGPANLARAVPAVTGACLMISRKLWERVGGLSGAYIQGDYEDSDLCLRLADLGYDSWYLPRVELYHLEGQSYPTHLRRQTSRFNTWLHTHLWGERIEALMARIDQLQTTHPAQDGES